MYEIAGVIICTWKLVLRRVQSYDMKAVTKNKAFAEKNPMTLVGFEPRSPGKPSNATEPVYSLTQLSETGI